MAIHSEKELLEPLHKVSAKEVDFEKMYASLVASLHMTNEPNAVVKKAYEELYLKGHVSESHLDQSLARKAGMTLGLDNDHVLVDTVGYGYETLAIQLRRQLIKDFSCTTYAEKTLVDVIVSAYLQHLMCATNFKDELSQLQSHTTREGVSLLGILSKEMERANRRMLSAFQILWAMKQPAPTVEINTQNAFIAKNQQLNINQP